MIPVAEAARFALMGGAMFESAVASGVVVIGRLSELSLNGALESTIAAVLADEFDIGFADDDDSGLRELRVVAGATGEEARCVLIVGNSVRASDDSMVDVAADLVAGMEEAGASDFDFDDDDAKVASNSFGAVLGVACTEVISFALLS